MKSFDCTVRFMHHLAEAEEAWYRSEVLAAVDTAAHSSEDVSVSGRRTAAQMDSRNGLMGRSATTPSLSASLAVSMQGSAPSSSNHFNGGSARSRRSTAQPASQKSAEAATETRKRHRSHSTVLAGGGDPVNYSALFHFLQLARRASNPEVTSDGTVQRAAVKLHTSLDTKLDLVLGAKSGVPIMSALDSTEMASCVATLHLQMEASSTTSAATATPTVTQHSAGSSASSSPSATPVLKPSPVPERATFVELQASNPTAATAASVPEKALRASTAYDRHFLSLQGFAATHPLGLAMCMLQVNPLNAPCGVREPLLHTAEVFKEVKAARPNPELVALLNDPMYQGALLLVHPLLPVSWWEGIKAALVAAMPNEPLTDPLQYGCIMCDALMCFGLDASSWDGLRAKMARAIEADNWAASRNGQQSKLSYSLVMQNWEAAVDLACMGLQGVQCLAASRRDVHGRVVGGAVWNQTAHAVELKAATSTRVVRTENKLSFLANIGSAEDVRSAVQWASWQMTQRLAALYSVCTTLHSAVAAAYSDGGVSATAPLDVIHTRRRLVFEALQRDVLPLFSAACGGDESGSSAVGWSARQALLRQQLQDAGGVWLGDGITPSMLTLADGSELLYPGDLWLLLGVAQYGAGAWHRVLYDPVLGLGWRPSNPVPAPPTSARVSSGAESLVSLGEPPVPGTASALVPLQSQVLLDCAYRSMPARVFACLWSNLASSCEACLSVVHALTLSGSIPNQPSAAPASAVTPQPAVSIPVVGLHTQPVSAAARQSASRTSTITSQAAARSDSSAAGPNPPPQGAPLSQPPPRAPAHPAATTASSSSSHSSSHGTARSSAAAAGQPIQLRDEWVVPHPQNTGWVALRVARQMLRERGDMLHQQLSTTVVQLQNMGINTSDFALRPVPSLYAPEQFPNYSAELRQKLSSMPPATASQLRDAHDRMVKYRERLATVYTCSRDPIEYVNLLQQLWQNRVDQGREPSNSQPPGTISAIEEVAKAKAQRSGR